MRISDWSSDVCTSDLAAGQIIARAARAPRPVADRGILPKGANFVKHRNAEPLADAQRRESAQHRRMGVEQVGLPVADERLDPRRERTDLAPFADRRAHRRDRRRAIKGQTVARLGVRARFHAGLWLAQRRPPCRLPPLTPLPLTQPSGAEGMTALRRY